ncbi:hypothetical protein O0L34_g19482 [Tuta absoluta]|nr:hypothetical protein O0L34_g19482 [Tuta absoluta]
MQCIFKEVDPKLFPIFVARELHKLPPVTFDHIDVTSLLNDILLLKTTVEEIKSNYVSYEHLQDIKDLVAVDSERSRIISNSNARNINMMNVNTKRGAYNENDSGPMGLSYLNQSVHGGTVNYNKTTNERSSCQDGSYDVEHNLSRSPTPGQTNMLPLSGVHKELQMSVLSFDKINEVSAPVLVGMNTAGALTLQDKTVCDKNIKSLSPRNTVGQEDESVLSGYTSLKPSDNCKDTSATDIANKSTTMADLVKKDGDWKTVYYRKTRINKNKLEGKMGKANPAQNGNFRAAESKVPILITNVHKETKECDIVNYIAASTNERVTLQQIRIKDKWKNHNAYKISVSKFKLALFLDESMWPEGIIFRRFVHFRAQKGALDGGVSLSPNLNG